MALKFLNKKGWHTGSLRNIENVWKAEQKQEAEQKKLEELQKQIREERERAEFRQIQVEAGLISKQERLEFLYDSGLAVGKGSAGFKALESVPKTESEPAASSSAKQQPGALFEEKPHSSNDAWRKLHSDPLLLIRQKEQEALARIKNNPVKMAMIRKSVQEEKGKDKEEQKKGKKHHRKMSKDRKISSSRNDSATESDSEDGIRTSKKARDNHHGGLNSERSFNRTAHTTDDESHKQDARTNRYRDRESDYRTEKSSSRTAHTSDDESHKQDARTNRYRGRESDYRTEKFSSRTAHTSDDESHKQDARTNRYRGRESDYRTEKSSSRTAHTSDDESHKQDARTNRYRDREYDHQTPGGTHSYNGNDEREHKKGYYESGPKKSEYEREPKKSEYARLPKKSEHEREHKKSDYDSTCKEYSSERQEESRHDKGTPFVSSDKPPRNEPTNRHRNPVKLSDEERAARLREMQMDAELHEQQRWTRLKKAADNDAQEAIRDKASLGRNFLDATQRSVYGAEKGGGASTIEESVRRRTHYSQRQSTTDSNAFRRS